METSISVVVLSYERQDSLRVVLEALKEQLLLPQEVIVVDNPSAQSDAIEVMIEKDFPDFTILRNEKNVGFSAAQNRGFQESIGDWVLFIVDDIKLELDFIQQMVFELNRASKMLGLLTGVVFNEDSTVNCAGGKLSFNPHVQIDVHTDEPDSYQPYDVTFSMGALMCVKREVFEEVGMFDEDIFIYYEDVDLSKRIIDHDYQIKVLPRARCIHIGAAFAWAHKPAVKEHQRNSFYYVHFKHLSFKELMHYLAKLTFGGKNSIALRFGWLKNSIKWFGVHRRSRRTKGKK